MEGEYGKKFACETCIKGHRSSSCKHFDRPRVEVKRKGRPATQCNHCRELRKVKQVHVKCTCQSKENDETGVPRCMCEATGECHCCIPRKSPPRQSKKPSDKPPQQSRVRPVLPQSSLSTSSSISRRDMHHSGLQPSVTSDLATLNAALVTSFSQPSVYSAEPTPSNVQAVQAAPESLNDILGLGDFPADCKCGDDCRCPACPEPGHSTSSEKLTESCPTCLECTLHTVATAPIVPATNSAPPSAMDAFTEVLQNGESPSVCKCGDNCGCPSCPFHDGNGANTAGESCATCLDCTLHTMIETVASEMPVSVDIPSATSNPLGEATPSYPLDAFEALHDSLFQSGCCSRN